MSTSDGLRSPAVVRERGDVRPSGSSFAATGVWVASLIPIAATVLPLVKSGENWIRVWDYPRSQLAVWLAGNVALQRLLLSRSRAAAWLSAGTLASLAWQLWRIYPYTPAASVQVLPATEHDDERSVGVLITNVLQTNRNAQALLAQIEQTDPDLVLALETDAWWDQQLSPLAERYPFVVRQPLENSYGMILYSRLALSDVKVQFRVEPDVPSFSALLHLRSGTVVDLHCLHPKPPGIGQDVDERDAELLLVGREVEASERAAIVCGDLNDVAWSATTRLFQRISRLLDPRVGRGLYATFHADYPVARWPLDHLFHDESFALRRLEVLESIGSDHFPIYVQLLHDPALAGHHEAPAANGDDRREASERIAEGMEPD